VKVWCIALVVLMSGPAIAQDDYGTHGFLGRVSEGTVAVDRCVEQGDIEEDLLRRRAADHYDRGLVLYEEGDYARSIEEFVASYCDKPHPNAFYNIAQAYERLLDYETAVAYFERYILEVSEAAPNRKRAGIRVEVLKGRPAQIRVATQPPGASVTLSGETGVTAKALANGSDPLLVEAGRYEMRIERTGYEPVTREIIARIGQPYSFFFSLEPRRGNVRVTASPGGSRIFVNKRLVGVGSYVETIPIGRYKLVVEAKGREPIETEIEVVADKPVEYNVVLESPSKSGRTTLLWASGLGLGIASNAILGVADEEGAAGTFGALLGGTVAFGGAYFGIPEEVTRAQAWYIIGTTLTGAAEGARVTSYFSCNPTETSEGTIEESCSSDAIGGGALAGAVGGLVVGSVTADFKLTSGDVALLNSAAIWGFNSGLLLLSIFDTDERIRDPMLFAGLNIGLVTGATLVARSDVSLGRVALIDLSGLAGLVGGFALGEAVGGQLERRNHFTLFGAAAGLVAGTFLTRYYDEDSSGPGTVKPALSAVRDASGKASLTFGSEFSF